MNWRLMQFSARVRARINRAKNEGILCTGLIALDLAISSIVWVLLLPLTSILHAAGFRRLNVITQRIGHLAGEPDCFLKARALGRIGSGHYFMLAPPHKVANDAMLDYWRSHITVIQNRVACWFLRCMSRWFLMKHDMSRYVLRLNASQEIYRINAEWYGRPPLLAVTDKDKNWSDNKLQELGISEGAWFVCVHVREPGYSQIDDDAQAYRNSDPRALYPAIEEIVNRGGRCVRMGDPSMTPMDPLPGLIDYAHHPLRSDRLDILLCARARFFLGNTSGLALVSSVFGVPSALANLAPLAVLPFLPGDIGIPKLLRSKSDGRLLSFSEVLHSPIGDYRYTRLYDSAGIELIENTPDEILSLAREMLDRLDGKYSPMPDEETLQNRFISLLRPGNYSYGTASRVSAAFLKKYENLLPSE